MSQGRVPERPPRLIWRLKWLSMVNVKHTAVVWDLNEYNV